MHVIYIDLQIVMIISVINRRLYCVLVPCVAPSLSEITEKAIGTTFFYFPIHYSNTVIIKNRIIW